MNRHQWVNPGHIGVYRVCGKCGYRIPVSRDVDPVAVMAVEDCPSYPYTNLTHEQLEQACRNIGFDLTCGSCALLFFTGTTVYAHDEGCRTPKSAPVEVRAGGPVHDCPDCTCGKSARTSPLGRARSWFIVNGFTEPRRYSEADCQALADLLADVCREERKRTIAGCICEPGHKNTLDHDLDCPLFGKKSSA